MTLQKVFPEDVFLNNATIPDSINYSHLFISFTFSALVLLDFINMMSNHKSMLNINYGPHTLVIASLNLFFEPFWAIIAILVAAFKLIKQYNSGEINIQNTLISNKETELFSR